MLLLKALHLITMVTWFAGLFYLPRLFVYHAMSEDDISIARFKIMERKLYYGITTPSGVLTLLFGLGLLSGHWEYYLSQPWMQIKLALILILVLYHLYCGRLVWVFRENKNTRNHVWYRWFNEIPVIFLIAIIILAVVKPF